MTALLIKVSIHVLRTTTLGGGGWGAPREGPRCPEVPGCFPGALPGGGRHLGPVGHVALPRVVPATPGRRKAALVPRSGRKNAFLSVFMIFGLFWLTFVCCVSDFACFGSFFSKNCPEMPSLWAAPGVALPEVRPHLGRPGVSPCPG